ncbi:AAA family ATPase [Actinoplanes missouriensis]|uniref:AAA family ATPase n=1 Tax=Actinoplanes missouriensis TaxID=1866 RepID=UPI00155DD4CA|nr:LuxR family transcriptional regulator [Actinoplanes missouriensis]
MISQDLPGPLLGRAVEQAFLDEALRRAETSGTAVLLQGAAGIGKTALLRDAARRAGRRGFRELHARGVQGAGAAGFTGLHEMLHPVLDRMASLPSRQRSALMVAFGEEDGPASDRLLISLATLGLLEETATAGPVLLTVEDLHWLDRSSAEVVAFLARRLRATPALLLATTRTDGAYADWSAAFPQLLPLSPLSGEDSARLLAQVAPALRPRARDQVLEISAGNPLALRELPEALRDSETLLPDPMPMTERLEQAFLAEVAQLPDAGRRVLLVAAAGEDVPATELVAAIGTAGLDTAGLDAAERAGLVRVTGGRVVFRHPLLTSAILGAASSPARAQAHRALAAVAADPSRAARHRAAATYGWDEEVATALEATADAAARRGANHEAMIAYQRSSELSPLVADRVRRLAEAAEAARRGGLTAEAAEVLRQAMPMAGAPDEVRALARTEWLLSMTSDVPGRSALDLTGLAAGYADPAEILLWAATKAFILQENDEVRAVIRAALDEVPADRRDALHEIGVTLLDPRRGLTTLRENLPEIVPGLLERHAEIVNVLAFTAEGVQDFATADRCWTAAIEHHHASGRIGDEAVTLCGRATERVASGDIAGGLADAERALRLSLDFDLPVVGAIAAASVALARAVRGEDAAAGDAVEQARTLIGAAPFARVHAMTSWAAGVLALNQGRHLDALRALEATAVNEPIALWAGADLVEAAVRSGRPEAAAPWLTTVEAAIGVAAFPERLLLARERSLALLSSGAVFAGTKLSAGTGSEAGPAGDARAHFESALEHGVRAGAGLELGRTHLRYGEWLRRERDITAARTHLERAAVLLREAGAAHWAAQAESGLAAAGGGTARPPGGRDDKRILTSRELEVARLAAQGLTNREIADQVYLSHRTVAEHLSRVFAKLGLSSRSQLAAALRDR